MFLAFIIYIRGANYEIIYMMKELHYLYYSLGLV